jgi:hypothetical protein
MPRRLGAPAYLSHPIIYVDLIASLLRPPPPSRPDPSTLNLPSSSRPLWWVECAAAARHTHLLMRPFRTSPSPRSQHRRPRLGTRARHPAYHINGAWLHPSLPAPTAETPSASEVYRHLHWTVKTSTQYC